MLRNLFLICLIVVTIECLGQSQNDKPGAQYIIDVSLGKIDLKQCSRRYPQNIKEFWTPTTDQIDSLNSAFEKYIPLTPFADSSTHLNKYAIQYVGIIVKGKQYIYLNAFRLSMTQDYISRGYVLNKDLVKACDGWFSFWGVLFDPLTAKFSDLAFNGIG